MLLRAEHSTPALNPIYKPSCRFLLPLDFDTFALRCPIVPMQLIHRTFERTLSFRFGASLRPRKTYRAKKLQFGFV